MTAWTTELLTHPETQTVAPEEAWVRGTATGGSHTHTQSLNRERKGHVFTLGSHNWKLQLKASADGKASARYYLKTQVRFGNAVVADAQGPEQSPGPVPDEGLTPCIVTAM